MFYVSRAFWSSSTFYMSRAFWSSITFYVSRASKNKLFTCSPTIYLATSLACPNHLPVRTADGAGGEDLAGP